MIYTLTFNPAIDYILHMDKKLEEGFVNRSKSEEIFFGGKGINVSIVLNELEIESTALGFVAGFTGDAIEAFLNEKGIKTDFVHLKTGTTRINVKIKSETETDINGQGPDIDETAIDEMFLKLENLKDGDILILSGSIPGSLPENIYELILKKLSGMNVLTVADATGELLLNVLKYRPFLIKPNNFELDEMFNAKLESIDDIKKYAKKLQEMGAVNVLVSMAGDGAVLLDGNGEFHICKPAKGKVINSVGAGDSMVAGFVGGYLKDGEYKTALKLGNACGAATAFSLDLAKSDLIQKIYNEI